MSPPTRRGPGGDPGPDFETHQPTSTNGSRQRTAQPRHRINYLMAYPEARRERWEREEREGLAERVERLEAEIAQLRRSA